MGAPRVTTAVAVASHGPCYETGSPVPLKESATVPKARITVRRASSCHQFLVIGAGGRLPPSRLVLFEALVNAIYRAAPGAAIVFNTRPEDTGAASARWI